MSGVAGVMNGKREVVLEVGVLGGTLSVEEMVARIGYVLEEFPVMPEVTFRVVSEREPVSGSFLDRGECMPWRVYVPPVVLPPGEGESSSLGWELLAPLEWLGPLYLMPFGQPYFVSTLRMFPGLVRLVYRCP